MVDRPLRRAVPTDCGFVAVHISIEQELFDLPRPKGSLLSWRERAYQTVVPNAERTVTGFSGTAGG